MHASYATLAKIIAINLAVMFLLTYVMLDSLEHFFFSLNRFYMALLMAAPMVVLMLALMRPMFPSRRLNAAIYATAVAIFVAALALVRTQVPIGDRQFLSSMIPHHSGAILMCERAAIKDVEVVRLCEQIVTSQQDEIAQMRGIIARIEE